MAPGVHVVIGQDAILVGSPLPVELLLPGVEVRAEHVHIECLLMGKLLAEIEIYCWFHVIYNILRVSETILPSLVSLRCNLAISPVELM